MTKSFSKFASTAMALVLAGSAMAADNYVVKDATGATITMRAKDVGAGVEAVAHTSVDSTGADMSDTVNHALKVNIVAAVPQGASAIAGSYADGWNMTMGLTSDAACASDVITCSAISLMKRANVDISTVNTNLATTIALLGNLSLILTKDTAIAASDATTATNTAGIAATNTALGTILGNTGTSATNSGTIVTNTANAAANTLNALTPLNAIKADSDTLVASAAAAIPAGTNTIGKVGIDQVTAGANTVTVGNASIPVTLAASVPLAAGSALVGKVGIDQTTPGVTNAVSITNSSIPVTLASSVPLAAGSALVGKVSIDQVTSGANTVIVGNSSIPVTLAAPVPLAASSALVGKVSIDQVTAGANTVTVGNGSLSVTGQFWQPTQPVSIASVPLPTGAMPSTGGTVGLVAGSALVGKVSIDQVTSGANTVTVGNASIPVTLAASVPLAAGSALVGKVGIDQTTPGTTNGVSITNASIPVTLASAPLPANAMTLTGGTVGLVAGSAIVGKVSEVDSTGADATDTTNHALKVNIVAGGSSNAVGQASTTSGETGPLVQGAVTTNPPTYLSGNTNALSLNPSGGLRVDGSNSTQPVSPTGSTSGGVTGKGYVTTASDNSTLVAAGNHTLYGMNILNASTTVNTVYYLRMYDLATAPALCAATGWTRSWPIPSPSVSGGVAGIAIKLPEMGIAFNSGIAFCVNAGYTSADDTSSAAGIFVNLDYK